MSDTTNETLRKCAFCGKSEKEVLLLIPAHDGKTYICESCTEMFADFLNENFSSVISGEKETDEDELTLETLPRPAEIKEKLDEYVIGQDGAKIALSVAVYNHYKRIFTLEKNAKAKDTDEDVDIQKSNVLMLGPT
jgi:ATP-dependent Clp protease ATP-binding subunit ClpX